jgi:hypothetical protein
VQKTDGDITGAATAAPGGEDIASCKGIVPLRQKVRIAPRFRKSNALTHFDCRVMPTAVDPGRRQESTPMGWSPVE